jgi:lysylphosphatidylglycerol synthetase-like protein (DUF2156 family)
VTDAAADAARTAGWRTVQIAEDTIIDLPRLAFKGKKWQDVRSALNKAKRESITFRMTTLAEEPFAILARCARSPSSGSVRRGCRRWASPSAVSTRPSTRRSR